MNFKRPRQNNIAHSPKKLKKFKTLQKVAVTNPYTKQTILIDLFDQSLSFSIPKFRTLEQYKRDELQCLIKDVQLLFESVQDLQTQQQHKMGELDQIRSRFSQQSEKLAGLQKSNEALENQTTRQEEQQSKQIQELTEKLDQLKKHKENYTINLDIQKELNSFLHDQQSQTQQKIYNLQVLFQQKQKELNQQTQIFQFQKKEKQDLQFAFQTTEQNLFSVKSAYENDLIIKQALQAQISALLSVKPVNQS